MAGNLFCVPGIQANTLECSYWGTLPTSTYYVGVHYSSLVPSGETRPLRIYDGFYRVDTLYSGVSHSLLVESPGYSSKWKYPLAWSHDDEGSRFSKMNMSQPVTLSPASEGVAADRLCFFHWNASTYSDGSFAIHYIIGP